MRQSDTPEAGKVYLMAFPIKAAKQKRVITLTSSSAISTRKDSGWINSVPLACLGSTSAQFEHNHFSMRGRPAYEHCVAVCAVRNSTAERPCSRSGILRPRISVNTNPRPTCIRLQIPLLQGCTKVQSLGPSADTSITRFHAVSTVTIARF